MKISMAHNAVDLNNSLVTQRPLSTQNTGKEKLTDTIGMRCLNAKPALHTVIQKRCSHSLNIEHWFRENVVNGSEPDLHSQNIIVRVSVQLHTCTLCNEIFHLKCLMPKQRRENNNINSLLRPMFDDVLFKFNSVYWGAIYMYTYGNTLISTIYT